MTLRRLLHWKTLFYDALLPFLRWLGPSRGDAALSALGRLVSLPGRFSSGEIVAARQALKADWSVGAVRRSLGSNLARFVARDCLLDGLGDESALARFEVRGYEHVEAARSKGRGVLLLGCHLGAYLAGIHWLYRKGVPVRLFVQRPGHVSKFLSSAFDRADGPHPQSGFFLRRRMPAGEGAEKLVRARRRFARGWRSI